MRCPPVHGAPRLHRSEPGDPNRLEEKQDLHDLHEGSVGAHGPSGDEYPDQQEAPLCGGHRGLEDDDGSKALAEAHPVAQHPRFEGIPPETGRRHEGDRLPRQEDSAELPEWHVRTWEGVAPRDRVTRLEEDAREDGD